MNRNQRNWDEVPDLFGNYNDRYNRLSDVQEEVFWDLYELFRRYVLHFVGLRNFGREREFWIWTWRIWFKILLEMASRMCKVRVGENDCWLAIDQLNKE
jgi:hypothetical protein